MKARSFLPAMLSSTRRIVCSSKSHATRLYATHASQNPVLFSERHHRVLVVGCGSAGLSIAHQLLRTGRFAKEDIAAIDPAEWHHYQPGWTLVGAGVKRKEDLRRPMKSLIDEKIKFHNDQVATFSPAENLVTLQDGSKLTYDQLVVVPGIGLNIDGIQGLREALADPDSPIASTYSYDNCDHVWQNISNFRGGDAIFTQPTGVVKCAGAPQKILWLAWHHWSRSGIYDPRSSSKPRTRISFATGLPVMFGVPKYSAKLDLLRQERGIEGLFQHDLISINGNTATFAKPAAKRFPDGERVKRRFDFLHVTPKMGPLEFVKSSPLANEAGLVDVDPGTLQHTRYANVWSCGDASNLPTSKTAAAITAQVPVLVNNLMRLLDKKGSGSDKYDGYTCCPLLTEYGKVMLAEFAYDARVKETFSSFLGDQSTPRRMFYYLKKDFFPWVYYKSMVKGTWAGPKGWMK